MPINTGLSLKTRFVWEKKKHIQISEIAIFFEVQAQIFVQLLNLQDVYSSLDERISTYLDPYP